MKIKEKNIKCWETVSEEETVDLGKKFGRLIAGEKLIIGLEGDLGAGKTTFVKGVAWALGIKEKIKSPTFVLLKEYQGQRGDLVHVDAYRLASLDVDSLGLTDYFGQVNVIIEWYKIIEEALPQVDLVITFKNKGKDKREICWCDLRKEYGED